LELFRALDRTEWPEADDFPNYSGIQFEAASVFQTED
jgi:hypothetical protein